MTLSRQSGACTAAMVIFLTRVILPPQTSKDGRLRIIVTEGFISDIMIQGDIGPVAEKVQAYLSNVLDEKPLL